MKEKTEENKDFPTIPNEEKSSNYELELSEGAEYINDYLGREDYNGISYDEINKIVKYVQGRLNKYTTQDKIRTLSVLTHEIRRNDIKKLKEEEGKTRLVFDWNIVTFINEINRMLWSFNSLTEITATDRFTKEYTISKPRLVVKGHPVFV